MARKRAREWNDHQSADADRTVQVIFASIETASTPEKRLRIVGQVVRRQSELVEIKRQAMRELKADGWTLDRIGSVLDIGASSVWRQLYEHRPFPKESVKT